MPNTINVHVIVDASLAGIESVRIRVPQGRRAAGLQFLDQLLPALKALNRGASRRGDNPNCTISGEPA